MNWLKRVSGNVATRLAVIAILAAIAWLSGTSRAHALDRGQAYAQCSANKEADFLAWCKGSTSFAYTVEAVYCQEGGGPTYGSFAVKGTCRAPAGHITAGPGAGPAQTYFYTGACTARPPLSGDLAVPYDYSLPTSPIEVCNDGCSFAAAPGQTSIPTYEVDGITWSVVNGFTPLGGVCVASDVTAPPVDSDGDGVSDELDAFPDDPTETTDSDGDGVGDNADFSPDDPTDGGDTEGEEDGDDEGDNESSGGGDCSSPPTCKGDGIQCNQLFQMWKLRCQGTAQGNVAGDVQNCSSGIVVTSPDAVANAQLLALRKIACNADSGGSSNVGDANNNGVADVLEGAGTTATDPDGDDDVTRFGLGINTDMLDTQNIFGGGSCPAFPSFQIMGATIDASSFPYFCDLMAGARVIILIMGAFTALGILMGRNT